MKIENRKENAFQLEIFALAFKKHYENMPMQYTEIFETVKLENFLYKIFDFFLLKT